VFTWVGLQRRYLALTRSSIMLICFGETLPTHDKIFEKGRLQAREKGAQYELNGHVSFQRPCRCAMEWARTDV
jgi:hypothetical protein